MRLRQILFNSLMLLMCVLSWWTRADALGAVYKTPSTPQVAKKVFNGQNDCPLQDEYCLTKDEEGSISETIIIGTIRQELERILPLLHNSQTDIEKRKIVEEVFQFVEELKNNNLKEFNLLCQVECWRLLLDKGIIKRDLVLNQKQICIEERLVYVMYHSKIKAFKQILKKFELKDASKQIEFKLDYKKWALSYDEYYHEKISLIINILAYLVANKKELLKPVFLSSVFFNRYINNEFLCKKLFSSLKLLFEHSDSKKERKLLKEIWRLLKEKIESDAAED